MVNKEQCRAARAWLGITQQALSEESGLPQSTIARFESGTVVAHDRTLRDIRAALERLGIEFLFDGARGVGIRIRK